MSILIVILIAVSLSMDAFSLSLAYGTKNINNIKLLSTIVGIFHFFMPILGMIVGKKIIHLLPIKPNTLVFIVLFLIGFEMIIETFKIEKEYNSLNLIEMFTFSFAVSIDSFSLGLSLETIYNPIISALIFMLSSMIFTYLGLKLGKYVNKKVGSISTIFGGITLIIIGIVYLM